MRLNKATRDHFVKQVIDALPPIETPNFTELLTTLRDEAESTLPNACVSGAEPVRTNVESDAAKQEDGMRQFLITKFVCANCGSTLELTYDTPKGAGRYAEGEPTGADMVQRCVAISPCRQCFAPLAEMKAAVKTLMSA